MADVSVIATLIGEREITPLRVRCRNISEAGLSASGLSSLAVGDRLTLELHIPVSTQAIWVEAVVRRTGDPCALEFASLTDDHRNLIRRYLRWQPEEKRRR